MNKNDHECLKWCHVRLLNPQKEHSNRIKMIDKKIAETLDYSGIEFPIKEKDYSIIGHRFNTNLNVFWYDKFRV